MVWVKGANVKDRQVINEELFDLVKKLAKIDEDLYESTRFKELMFESLLYIAFLVEVEEMFDITVNDSLLELKDDRSIGDITDEILEKIEYHRLGED